MTPAQMVNWRSFLSRLRSSNLTCWWQPEILPPKPTRAQHSLCRAASGVLICAETQREEGEKKSRAESKECYSVLFVAATLCYRVVAAWRRSSPPFLSLLRFLSLTHEHPHSHRWPLALCLKFLCTLVLLHLPFHPSSLPLARHHQNIDILNVLQ